MEDKDQKDQELKEAAVAFRVPPKIVHNDRGETVEVILSYEDYKTFLRFLADHIDWELLPGYLQDAVDGMLADEARVEQGDESFTTLDEFLSDLGIESESGTSVEE
jgi:hypothetical protein